MFTLLLLGVSSLIFAIATMSGYFLMTLFFLPLVAFGLFMLGLNLADRMNALRYVKRPLRFDNLKDKKDFQRVS